jgi:phage gp46-like protein
MERFTDLAAMQDDEGLYDLKIDPFSRDFVTVKGLESASFVSLFSDRRAHADEVHDPMERRGWIGNIVSDVPNDNHGSGLWLYEQRRLTPDVANGVRVEAEQSHTWMLDERIVDSVSASVVMDPVTRTISLILELSVGLGNISTRSYVLVNATRTGLLAQM